MTCTVPGHLAWLPWLKPLRQGAETLVAAGQVIPERSAMLASGGWPPSPAVWLESQRMVWEKVVAFNAAALQAQLGLYDIGGRWMLAWLQAASGGGAGPLLKQAAQLSPALAATTEHALAPVHQRATGNARRLARRR